MPSYWIRWGGAGRRAADSIMCLVVVDPSINCGKIDRIRNKDGYICPLVCLKVYVDQHSCVDPSCFD
jgi:hypothetical protein